MNSNPPQQKSFSTKCIAIIIVIVAISLLILDVVSTVQLINLNRQIANLQAYVSCKDACYAPYINQYSSKCCTSYATNCKDKQSCVDWKIEGLTSDKTGKIIKIIAFSSLFFILFGICCGYVINKVARKGFENNFHPLNENLNVNINQSEHSTGKIQKGQLKENYESFQYYDSDNHCCICLEQFKDEKAILLKCGHIFHSACIRDWAAKQQNCPICRSKQ